MTSFQRHPPSPEGTLQRILFRNPDSGWTVARLEGDSGRSLVVVGALGGVGEGETLRLHGRWEEDARWGEQFRVERYERVRPTTLEGIERYLAAGWVKGVGPALAKRIVARFKHRTLQVLEEEPHELHRVPGLGRARVRALTEAWRQQQAVHEVMLFLQSHGVSQALATRIHAQYGQEALHKVNADPYLLAREVTGVGFRTADGIARAMGLPADAPQRLETGLLYALRQAADAGHCFLPRARLLEQAQRLLQKDDTPTALPLPDALKALEQHRDVVVETEADHARVYTGRLHSLETGAARHLERLVHAAATPLPPDVHTRLAAVDRRLGIRLAPEQRHTLEEMTRHKIMVLTGGPGTGKTTLVRTITDLFVAADFAVVLCAPTGRAAKRLAEASGRDTWTLHRLLEWQPRGGGFLRGPGHPLEGDLIIVDEASMLDLPLLHALLRALPDAARLLLVGDVDQLPSVGPGRVLQDVIESARVPTQVLNQVFRQHETSPIIDNAHRMRAGHMPRFPAPGERGDFVFIERDGPEEVLRVLLSLVAERLPRTLGVDARRDIQVLVPMNRGPLGTHELNRRLQESLNPNGLPLAQTGLRVGDKVMQVRNNYQLETFNGDIGVVDSWDADDRAARVRFDEQLVRYELRDIAELHLAYACTVHKAQGSEYPVLVFLVHTQHHIMLQRNLLYTAVTRARRQVVLLGQSRALQAGLRRSRRQIRHTHLAARLQQALEGGALPAGSATQASAASSDPTASTSAGTPPSGQQRRRAHEAEDMG